jgi:hypothetical protein
MTVIRLIQGIRRMGRFCIARDGMGTNEQKPRLLSSWPQFAAPAGFFLANLAVLFFRWLSGDQFSTFGWRIPFSLSIVTVGIESGLDPARYPGDPGVPEGDQGRAHQACRSLRCSSASQSRWR